MWICSFCGTENDLKSELPDLVGKTDVFYVADPGKPPELKAPETSRIIFVIDTSASMSQTKPVSAVLGFFFLFKIIACILKQKF